MHVFWHHVAGGWGSCTPGQAYASSRSTNQKSQVSFGTRFPGISLWAQRLWRRQQMAAAALPPLSSSRTGCGGAAQPEAGRSSCSRVPSTRGLPSSSMEALWASSMSCSGTCLGQCGRLAESSCATCGGSFWGAGKHAAHTRRKWASASSSKGTGHSRIAGVARAGGRGRSRGCTSAGGGGGGGGGGEDSGEEAYEASPKHAADTRRTCSSASTPTGGCHSRMKGGVCCGGR